MAKGNGGAAHGALVNTSQQLQRCSLLSLSAMVSPEGDAEGTPEAGGKGA